MFWPVASFLPQDTIVALQALACYAAFSGANAIDLRLRLSDQASSFVSLFHINSSNYLTYQTREVINQDGLPRLLHAWCIEYFVWCCVYYTTMSSWTFFIFIFDFMFLQINADREVNLNIYMEGRGFAIFQVQLYTVTVFLCLRCTFMTLQLLTANYSLQL